MSHQAYMCDVYLRAGSCNLHRSLQDVHHVQWSSGSWEQLSTSPGAFSRNSVSNETIALFRENAGVFLRGTHRPSQLRYPRVMQLY